MKTNFKRFLSILLVTMLTISCLPLQTAAYGDSSSNDVILSFKTDKKSYALGDTVTLTVRATNTSNVIKSVDLDVTPVQSSLFICNEEFSIENIPANGTKTAKYELQIANEEENTFASFLKGLYNSFVKFDNKVSFTVARRLRKVGFDVAETTVPEYILSFAESVNGTVDATAAGAYTAGSVVELEADADDGYSFIKWESSNGGDFENAKTSVTAFTMPEADVVITAVFAKTDVVPDEIAALFGISPDDYDTDGDGLSNYVEIYRSETDPLCADSDEDGILDADEDEDCDGLTNLQELELGTELVDADSDNDGVSDGDEVNKYNTDPLEYDTDGDMLSDGDEIALGLDPLCKKTDGVTNDAEKKIVQTIDGDDLDEVLSSDKNGAVPSLTMSIAGLITKKIGILTTDSAQFGADFAIIGEAVDVVGDIDSAVLTFALDAATQTELICKYTDGEVEYLQTEFDAEYNTVSAKITSAGTYYVLSAEKLINVLGMDPSDNGASAFSNKYASSGSGYQIYLNGPVPVEIILDKAPSANSTADTDGDGLLDRDELILTSTIEIDLDALFAKTGVAGTSYGTVTAYNYNSDPTLNDTDFDGIDDAEDTEPKINTFTGLMHYSGDKDKLLNIDFNVDYRDFISGSNTLYSRDISEMLVLYASDVYVDQYVELKTGGVAGGSDDPVELGTMLGLADAQFIQINKEDYTVDTDDVTEFFVGHRNVYYEGKYSEVIIVSVRGTNGTVEEWSSNFDVGADTPEYYTAVGSEHPDWTNKDNHKGFDVSANRVYAKLNDYIDEYVDDSSEKVILITGHSRGAAIANILGTYFEDDAKYRSFTYTFATPNTTTADYYDEYNTIFNIKNTDDLITYMPIEEWGFKNYGITKTISVEDRYEDKAGGFDEGTWEWFIGTDYNNDGGTNRTLTSFAKVAKTREDLYKLDTTKDGKVWENNVGHTTVAGAEKELAKLKVTLESERLLRFCDVYVVKGFIKHVEINYSPAYLMQTLANMTCLEGPLLGRDVKGKYASAKASFVASSGFVVVGGMTHPHMAPTYYIIAHGDSFN